MKMSSVKWILCAILLLAPLCFAQDPKCSTDQDDIYSLMFGGHSLWKPSGFSSSSIADPCDHTKKVATVNYTSGIISVVGKFGIAIFFCMFAFEAARRLLSGQGLHFTEAIRFYATSIPVAVLLGLAVTGGYEDVITGTVIKPIEAVVGAVMSSSSDEMLKKFSSAYDSYAATNQSSSTISSFIAIFSLSIPLIIANAGILVSLVIIWVMSLYISVMCTVVMCLGPLFLPFVIFQPLSQIGWNWVKTMIAYPMMCIVGAVATSLLMGANMLNFSVETGQSSSYLVSIATSIMFILVIIMVPSITNGFMEGVQAAPMAAGRALARGVSTGLGGAASAAVLTGGAATYVAGRTTQATATMATKANAIGSWAAGSQGSGGFRSAVSATAERSTAHQVGGKIASAGAAAFEHESMRIVPGLRAVVGGAKAASRGWEKDKATDWSGNKSSWEKTHSDWSGKPGNWEEPAKKQNPKSQHADITGFAYQAYGKETAERLDKASGSSHHSFGEIPPGMYKYDFMKARVDELLTQYGIQPEKSYLNTSTIQFASAIKSDSFVAPKDKEYLQSLYQRMASEGASSDEIAYSLRAEAVQRSGNALAMMNYVSFMQTSKESRQEYLFYLSKKYGREYDTSTLPTNFLPRPIPGRTYEDSVVASMDRRFGVNKAWSKTNEGSEQSNESSRQGFGKSYSSAESQSSSPENERNKWRPSYEMTAKQKQQRHGDYNEGHDYEPPKKEESAKDDSRGFSKMSYNRFIDMNQDSRKDYVAYVAKKHGLSFDLSKLPDEYVPYQGKNRTYEQGVLKALNHYFTHRERIK